MTVQVSQSHRLSGIGVQLRVTAQHLRHALAVIESNRRQGPEQTRGEAGALLLWQAQCLACDLINAHTNEANAAPLACQLLPAVSKVRTDPGTLPLHAQQLEPNQVHVILISWSFGFWFFCQFPASRRNPSSPCRRKSPRGLLECRRAAALGAASCLCKRRTIVSRF